MSDNSSKATILVVDDSPTVLRVMEGVLTQAGYAVTCLENGSEVVDTARRLRPTLIFVDFAMPEVSGYAVCEALGKEPELESIPIVLMNTRGDEVGDRFIREMGIVDHVTKPFPPEVLLAVVEHTLHRTGDVKRTRRRVTEEPDFELDDVEMEATRHRRTLAAMLARAVDPTSSPEEIIDQLDTALDDPIIVEAMRRLLGPQTQAASALRGELSVIPIAEVLQVLALQRQNGFLRAHRDNAEVSIAVKDGDVRLVTGTNLPDEFLLGHVMVRERLISQEDLELFLTNRRGSRRRMGTQVVKLGYLSQPELHHALRCQSSELVYELLRWTRGHFTFEPRHDLPDEVLEFEFGLTIDELLMEGFRRVDEWGLIESAIPSFEGVPCLTPAGADSLAEQGLEAQEKAVLAAINGTKNVREIVREVGSSSFDVARVLYRLVSTRAVAMQLQIK